MLSDLRTFWGIGAIESQQNMPANRIEPLSPLEKAILHYLDQKNRKRSYRTLRASGRTMVFLRFHCAATRTGNTEALPGKFHRPEFREEQPINPK